MCILLIFTNLSHANQYIITESDLADHIDIVSSELEENGAKSIVKNYSDAIVLIYTINNSAEDDGLIYNSAIKKRIKKHHYKYGVISGVVLSDSGIICTTAEGLMNSDEIIVSFNSELRGEREDSKILIGEDDYKAKIIKIIPELNLAFLKIRSKSKKIFHHVDLGNDVALLNGKDRIFLNGAVVIGKARGENFVTKLRPANSRNNFTMHAAGVEKLIYKKNNGVPILLIENSVSGACIIPENEGGAVLDMKGKLIGLATFNSDDFSITTSTAIPVSIIKRGVKIAVPALITEHDNTDLGMKVIAPQKFEISSDLKKVLKISDAVETLGAAISFVELGSVADDAGIQQGDIILKFNDDIVSSAEMYMNLEKLSIGEQVVFLQILRGKNLLNVEINK
jgi:S1-C subfamily serine protease